MIRKKRIVFLITSSEIGGAQRWVSDHIKILSDQFHVTLITNEEGWLTKEVSCCSDVICDKRIEMPLSVSYLANLIIILKRISPHCVICSSAYAGVYGRIACLFFHARVVYISHGWSCLYHKSKLRPFNIFVERVLASITDTVICVSSKDMNDAVHLIGISEHRVKLLRNSIILKHEENLPATQIGGVLMVARAAPPKRPDLLIDAARHLKVMVTLVGVEANDLGSTSIPENVRLLGKIPGFSDFSSYDVFVLLSESEGIPISILEAMSNGLPIVASNVGGCVEVVNENGFLVENDDLNDVINKINCCLENKSELGERSLAIFNRRFNLFNCYEHMVSKLLG